MIEKFSFKKFAREIAKEIGWAHQACTKSRDLWGNPNARKILELKIELKPARGSDTLVIVLRGNLIGTIWKMLDQEFSNDQAGWCKAFDAAGDVAMAAHKIALAKDVPVLFKSEDHEIDWRMEDPEAMVAIEVPGCLSFRAFLATPSVAKKIFEAAHARL